MTREQADGAAKTGYNEEKDIILAVLRLGTGLAIDFADMLYLCQMEDGRFGVWYDESGRNWKEVEEWLFDDAEEAATFYVAKRHEKRLGYDHETDSDFYRRKAARKEST